MRFRISNHSPLQSLCAQCRHKVFTNIKTASLSTTSHNLDDSQTPATTSRMSALSATLRNMAKRPQRVKPTSVEVIEESARRNAAAKAAEWGENQTPFQPSKPHHLHIWTHKHNTHLTLSNGQGRVLISVSAGNIGFRKSKRGSYDAGFQLGAYLMGRINQRGWLRDIDELELIFRDFGPGRNGITKILLGVEGKYLRNRIIRVMDATRLKHGGTRSPKSRRLG